MKVRDDLCVNRLDFKHRYIFMVLFLLGFTAGIAFCAQTDVLVEAEIFQDKGGWKVDQQFCDVMGSSYLLAHGLGEAVQNATTTVDFPAEGQYTLWVRTKDWVPGNWEAPGRFQVLVDSRAVKTTFGTQLDWHWQKGGLVHITDKQVTVELKDLTGFDGRCDALFFTQDDSFVPPNEGRAMRNWRNNVLGIPDVPAVTRKFDVVIVGGIAGCAASLAAAQQGLIVALINDRAILGGNASGQVRVHTEGIVGKGGYILNQLNTVHWPNGASDALKDDIKRHAAIDAMDNIKQFLGWRAYDAKADNGKILYVDARQVETGKTQRFRAPVFIDCTGDGWVGYWTGADYRYGRESHDEFNEGWDEHGQLWSPKKPDNRVMGSSLLWNSCVIDQEVTFPDVPWAMPVAMDHAKLKGEWFWEYSDNNKHQIEDAEDIRDHLLRAIYGSFANAKKNPANKYCQLEFVGYLIGKRESRRLMGDYIYTMRDMTENRVFEDAVVEEIRSFDVHYQRLLKDSKYDFLSEAMFWKTKKYYIPFRCLYSRNIKNLMMAGRCFSCSHVGLGGPRVMNTTGQMGIAAGYAASLCIRYDTNPRGVYLEHIAELQKLIGYE